MNTITEETSVYQATQERCSLDDMKRIEVRAHLARYTFAIPYIAGKRVLDIACGTGYGSNMMRQHAASVIGVDVDLSAIAYCQETYGGDYRVGSMIDFNGGPFDAIVSFETIEHIDDDQAALKNLRRVLVPGGTLVLSTPNRPVNDPRCKTLADKPSNPFHVREFTVQEMADALMAAGFSRVQRFGQRQRRLIPSIWRYPYAVIAHTLLPGHFSSNVLPLKRGLEPRYMVLLAQ